MYQENEKNVATKIRESYMDRSESKVDQLRQLDRKAKLPAEIFAYIFGIAGSLVLGVGMCLAMKVFANLMALGIVVGCVGIAMVSVNYLIYKKIALKGKKKYSHRILQLTSEVLGEQN